MSDPIRLDAWQSLAEARIRQAQEAGEFDNLPGQGEPIPGTDGVEDEHWWIKQKVRREQFSLLPPGLQIRVEVERGLAEIWNLPSDSCVRSAVAELNERIRAANLPAIWGPPSTTLPLDVEDVIAQWLQTNSCGRKRND